MKKILTYILAILPLALAGQQEVAFPDGAVYWAAYDSAAGTYHVGVTLPGQVTTTGQPVFDTMRNEMQWLGKVAAMPVEFDTLPAVGERLEARDIYRWGEALLIVRQTHDRTIFAPDETPALFGVYRPEDPAAYLDWVPNEDVFVNTIRRFEGQLYAAIQAHFTLEGFTPPATPALWKPYEEPGDGCPAWQQPLGSFDAYPLGACVTFEGQEWISTVDANVWQPGVFGWVLKDD
jgi:hypothetical protein